MFEGLAMEQLEQEWTSYPVIHLDLSKGKFTDLDALHITINSLLEVYESQYALHVECAGTEI